LPRVVVVGAGVSGLSAAYRLRERRPDIDVVVLEASDRAGGLLRTERGGGCLVERGPESFITTKTAALELIEKLGMQDQLIRTEKAHQGAYVVHAGRLERIPAGFSVLGPGRIRPLLRSPLLSWRGKARALVEPLIPRARGQEDESLGSFVERRYGREMLDRLAQPLAGGIYGADPFELSLRSTMPRFLDLEERFGSVTVGLRRGDSQSAGAAGARYGLFVTLRDGMESLSRALVEALPGGVRLNEPVKALARVSEGWRVCTDDAEIDADAVIIATPASVAGHLLREVSPEAARGLSQVHLGSAAAVTMAFKTSDLPRPLDAFGFVVPAREDHPVMAATFSSVKWQGRAPEGISLIRVFLGGAHLPEVPGWSDEALERSARDGLRRWLRIGVRPETVWLDRWHSVMPRYRLGHAARTRQLRGQLRETSGLALCGTAFDGVGVPDAVRTGGEAAERVLVEMKGRARN